jgi:sugar phosphate isomerase/epimerase
VSAVHPRVGAHPNAFPRRDPLVADLERLQRLGIPRASLYARKIEKTGIEETREQCAATGVEITHVVHPAAFTLEDRAVWPEQSASLVASIEATATLGVPLLYITTGPAGSLLWDEALAALDEALQPARTAADAAGVRLLLETTNPQYADIDCLHTLRDTVDAAEALGLGVCLDIHATWTNPDLEAQINRAAPLTAIVQVADYVPPTRDLSRATPGDGVIPLERILGWVLATGYEGLFEVELVDNPPGPEGDAALARGIAHLSDILARLGA